MGDGYGCGCRRGRRTGFSGEGTGDWNSGSAGGSSGDGERGGVGGFRRVGVSRFGFGGVHRGGEGSFGGEMGRREGVGRMGDGGVRSHSCVARRRGFGVDCIGRSSGSTRLGSMAYAIALRPPACAPPSDESSSPS